MRAAKEQEAANAQALQKQIDFLNETLADARAAREQEAANAQALQKQIDFQNETLADMRAAKEQEAANAQALQKQIDFLNETLESTRSARERDAAEARKLREEIASLKAAFDGERESCAELRLACEQKDDEISTLRQGLRESGDALAALQARERRLLSLLSEIKYAMKLSSENASFRIAKFLQLLAHPDFGGFSGRASLLWKLLGSSVSRKPWCPDYLALNHLLNRLDDGVRQIGVADDPAAGAEDFQPTDESTLISVVLPVYNQADLLAESVDSVVAQTYRNWELIVLNDGSTDDVGAVMEKYRDDKRIHYIVQKNQRLPKALSNAFRYVRGELLTWTSADNNMRPGMLARLADFMQHHPDVDLVYADYAVIDQDGKPFHAAWFRPQNKYYAESCELHLPRSVKQLNVVKDNFIGASFMYRRSVLGILGDYDPRLGVEDYDYWMRLNTLGKISHLGSSEILYDYRVHGNSLNGKAVEFKILEKSIALMEYEKKRSVFYRLPFVVYGSYRDGDLAFGNFSARLSAQGVPDAAGGDTKNVLLVKGGELGKYSIGDFLKYDFVGAFFDLGEEHDAGKFATLIRLGGVHCFARPGSPAAAYLAIFTSDLIECSPGEFGRLALACANNRIFWDRTHEAAEVALLPPESPRKADSPLVVLMENIGVGGMEQVALDMSKHFAESGRRTFLVCVRDYPPDIRVPRGVTFKALDKGAPETDFRNWLDQLRPDAVIAHYTTWGAGIAHERGIPFYQVLHNIYAWFGDEQIRDYRNNDVFTTGYAAVSAAVAWDAVERLKLPPQKIAVIENGIDCGRFRFSAEVRRAARRELNLDDDAILLLNPASCYGAKGQLHLIHAFAKAAAGSPRLRLIMAGKILEDAYANDIRKVIAENHLEDRVSFGMYYSDMNKLYNAADAVVNTSFWEGCSLALAEAVQYGCPVIATRTGDVERQTAHTPHLLIDLPLRYQTELNPGNFKKYLYKPNAELIDRVAAAFAALEAGELKRADRAADERRESAADAYERYLRMIDLQKIGFAPDVIRHNL